MLYRFVECEKANHVTMCRVLGVSPSGYYPWRQRSPSARARANVSLTEQISVIHQDSRGIYGAPRSHRTRIW